MENTKEFLVLRYSLVEEKQRAALTEPIPSPKGKAILAALVKDREFLSKGVRYGFIGFSKAKLGVAGGMPSERFYIGKTAKLKKAHIGSKIPGDIIETEEDDWVPLLTIIDIETQHIFVRKDWKFGTPEQTIRAIQSGLREPILALYNHRVFVEGKTKKEHFWRVVSEHKRVYKLELNLISPNILETNLRAREALEALKSLFGQDEVSIKLENESGELRVPREPVGNYLDYIEEGEGSWALTTEGERGGKRRHSSIDNLDVVDLPILDKEPEEEARQMGFEEQGKIPARISAESQLIAAVYAHVGRTRDL